MKNLIAQIGNPALPGSLTNQTGEGFIGNLLNTVITGIFIIGVIAFMFMLLTGGVQWIMSGGEKANIEAARSKLVSALVGLILLILVFAIVKVIENIFGVKILTIDIESLNIAK